MGDLIIEKVERDLEIEKEYLLQNTTYPECVKVIKTRGGFYFQKNANANVYTQIKESVFNLMLERTFKNLK